MPDMLVRLYDMPKIDMKDQMAEEGIKIKRAMALDKGRIVKFIRAHFDSNWEYECEYALFNHPSSCYIAVKDKEIIGFACYDATAPGFFGPTGVSPDMRGKGVGKALLGQCLDSMKEKGYGYAIIGYATDAIDFYKKTVNAMVIEGSTVSHSIYSNMASAD